MRLFVKSPLAALAVAALLIAGCGSPTVENSPEVFENHTLSEVGDMYQVYIQAKSKPPKSLKDLNAMFSEGYSTTLTQIKTGEVIVFWDVPLNPDPSADSADEVLAYFKDVPESGGFTLMKDHSIKKMTPEQFQAAPKAGVVDEAASKDG